VYKKGLGKSIPVGGIKMGLQAVFQPKSLMEAIELLDKVDNSKLLAGGTDLIIELNNGRLLADNLIDIRKLEELNKIRDYKHHIIIGSAVTFTDLLHNKIFNSRFTCMKECSAMMGSPQIRNRATIGGNIINAAAACDITPCLMALEAVLIIESLKQLRLVRISDYFSDYDKNKIKSKEILTGIILNDTGCSTGFYKLGKRNSLSIARLNAAVSIKLQDNKIKDFKLALGAVGRYPFRVYEIEYLAHGKEIGYLYKEQVLNIIQSKVEESIKGRPTLPFKKEAVKGVYMEALNRALKAGGMTINNCQELKRITEGMTINNCHNLERTTEGGE
jgi:CO/xanthine dehydrogenase FAD-binding subunit